MPAHHHPHKTPPHLESLRPGDGANDGVSPAFKSNTSWGPPAPLSVFHHLGGGEDTGGRGADGRKGKTKRKKARHALRLMRVRIIVAISTEGIKKNSRCSPNVPKECAQKSCRVRSRSETAPDPPPALCLLRFHLGVMVSIPSDKFTSGLISMESAKASLKLVTPTSTPNAGPSDGGRSPGP